MSGGDLGGQSSVQKAAAKVDVGGIKFGLSVENNHVIKENDVPVVRPSIHEIVRGFKVGNFEGSNAEVGVSVSGSLIPPSAAKKTCQVGRTATRLPVLRSLTDTVRQSVNDRLHQPSAEYDGYGS